MPGVEKNAKDYVNRDFTTKIKSLNMEKFGNEFISESKYLVNKPISLCFRFGRTLYLLRHWESISRQSQPSRSLLFDHRCDDLQNPRFHRDVGMY